jgi:hypothetical protein
VLRGLGIVNHSIAILYHEVPNLSITIRNFYIAVHPRVDCIRCHCACTLYAGENTLSSVKRRNDSRVRNRACLVATGGAGSK